ncbi:hypothetical protein [Rhodanobacter caeni]|uniref:DUF4340 domain-containing protein n=1 Tax=Rhodanobacter caeni TaxID=657654 RepID=A0ABN0UGC6_9GAMM
MTRASRRRLALLAVVVALLAVAGWQWRREAQATPGSLLALDPAAVDHVALAVSGAPAMHYEKRDGHWWAVDGTPHRSDDGRLAELADTAAARVLSWRQASDFQPAKIGLAPPAAVLTLNGQRIEFGETSVTGPQRYVRVGDRIALIPAHYTPRPPTGHVTDLH